MADRIAPQSKSSGSARVAAMSVIIPVRNGASDLAMCLQALQESSVLPAEVLVVDDGSDDKSTEVAERYGARVLRLPESHGPAAARNAGAHAALQPVLMFLDADVRVHPDTIELTDVVLSSDGAVGALFGAYDDAPLAPGPPQPPVFLLCKMTECRVQEHRCSQE